MKLKNRIVYASITSILLAFVLFSAIFSPFCMHAVTFAEEENIVFQYEETNVWDDLKNSTIAGNAFNPEDYPHSEGKEDKPSIISFVEFCYSLYSDNQDDYGLYVYVYNPQDLAFDRLTSRNKIQMRCGNGGWEKYNLVFLNYSKEEGYEGRFWKFKVNLTETQKNAILKDLDRNERTYEISGITLSAKKVAKEYPCGQKYTYSGYVQGYGFELAENDTLKCKVDGFDTFVELNVKQTCYRPVGDYYNGEQSQLNSCYFRVPEKYFESYGELTKVLCEWWEYWTKPILVTESYDLYQKLYKLHGKNVNLFDPLTKFLILTIVYADYDSLLNGSGGTSAYASNIASDQWQDDYAVLEWGHKWIMFPNAGDFFRDPQCMINNFAAVFYTGDGVSYINKFITSEELKSQLLTNSDFLGEHDISDRYSSSLFESVDNVDAGHESGYNRKLIAKSDPDIKLFHHQTTKSTWQRIFGGYDRTTIYDDVPVMDEVKKEDLVGSDEEISKRLYVSEKDVADIKKEFNACKDERLVLLRYGSSVYNCYHCVESRASANTKDVDEVLVEDCMKKAQASQFTSYVAQETVYLDFDIISLTFTLNDVDTEIPVVMSPQDVISGLDPPLAINFHKDSGLKWWHIVLIVIGILLCLWLLVKTGVLSYIVKGVAWLICLPFRLIAYPFKRKQKAADTGGGQSMTKSVHVSKEKNAGRKRTTKKTQRRKRK